MLKNINIQLNRQGNKYAHTQSWIIHNPKKCEAHKHKCEITRGFLAPAGKSLVKVVGHFLGRIYCMLKLHVIQRVYNVVSFSDLY